MRKDTRNAVFSDFVYTPGTLAENLVPMLRTALETMESAVRKADDSAAYLLFRIAVVEMSNFADAAMASVEQNEKAVN